MPSVHYVGKIKGASRFESRFQNLSLSWRLVVDEENGWSVLQGAKHGRTQIDSSWCSGAKVWDHPIDVHVATTNIDSWPKLHVEVWSRDEHGRDDIVGYGACFLPTEPGEHHLEVVTWRPRGGVLHWLSAFFLGGYPRLLDPTTVTSGADRFELETVTGGVVLMTLEVVHAGLEAAGAITQTRQAAMDL